MCFPQIYIVVYICLWCFPIRSKKNSIHLGGIHSSFQNQKITDFQHVQEKPESRQFEVFCLLFLQFNIEAKMLRQKNNGKFQLRVTQPLLIIVCLVLTLFVCDLSGILPA